MECVGCVVGVLYVVGVLGCVGVCCVFYVCFGYIVEVFVFSAGCLLVVVGTVVCVCGLVGVGLLESRR